MSGTARISYFDSEGRTNLPEVIKVLRAYLKLTQNVDRAHPLKIIFLTSQGEGPALAYKALFNFHVKIIAVTFPPGFRVRLRDDTSVSPEIPMQILAFFKQVGIEVVRGRLPFETIYGATAHNEAMSLIKNTLALFGRSVPLAVQCVLQACDFGLVDPGEQVLAATGDCALLVTASNTQSFLRDYSGLEINEIICKPRVFSFKQMRVQIEAEALPNEKDAP
jgi:hypothetical protein